MFEFAQDIWGFAKKYKKFWLIPIIINLVFVGALIVFAEGSAMSPLLYTLF